MKCPFNKGYTGMIGNIFVGNSCELNNSTMNMWVEEKPNYEVCKCCLMAQIIDKLDKDE